MWYDSLDNGEPLQLSQGSDTSYQLFGSLCEILSEDEFDPLPEQNLQETEVYNAPHVQAEPWSDLGCSFFMQELPAGASATCGYVVQGGEFAQSCQATGSAVQSKSAVLNQIQKLESTSFTLDEEIEEQKNRNASLEKQIADGEEQLGKINVQGISLKGELQEITEEQREFEFKLDHEIRQLTEFIDKKRRNISEIKHDVDMVHTLREDDDKMRYEMQKLQEQLEDINLDIYWMDHTFSHDLDRMVIFPLWKIEEDLERALDGEDPTLFDEPGPPEREDDEGDGYDYDDHDFDSYDEEASDEEETDESSKRSFDSDSFKSSNASTNSNSPHSSVKKEKERTGSKLGKLLANIFHCKKTGKKNQQKKVSKSSRFARWFNRLSCISKQNKDY
ncbi:golgin subfamily A member 6-like protein 24 [Montipora capricornis]|uniref:golgin subfamily A member 6-like protein 24 n=1 Tax=Montipora capricornis TaxID=246305 RepID=UPI0035F1D462